MNVVSDLHSQKNELSSSNFHHEGLEVIEDGYANFKHPIFFMVLLNFMVYYTTYLISAIEPTLGMS
jgi:hypothetical protein